MRRPPMRVHAVLVILAAIWCGLIIAAPLLKSAGAASVSSLLYDAFSRICHQIDDRSFHIAGQKFAVCIRCSSIYFGFLISLLTFGFLKSIRLYQSPPVWILFAGLAPMAFDVMLSLGGIHASTMLTRLISGFAAGLILPPYIVPPFLEAFQHFFGLHGGSSDARKAQ